MVFELLLQSWEKSEKELNVQSSFCFNQRAALHATHGVSEFDFDQTKDSEASCGGGESRLGAVGEKVAKLVVTKW